MKIEKLPSGHYRVRQSKNGKRYTLTFDHKPTSAEISLEMAKKIEKAELNIADMTFERACETYIDAKSNILSPTTISGYKSLIKNIPEYFKATKIQNITTLMLQKYINDYSSGHSPKSTSNMNGFIVSVLKFSGIEIKSPKLPQKEKKDLYIPTKEDVKRIFDAVKGTRYEIPFFLLMLGLRRSETCALELSDLKGNELTVNKAKVQNYDKEWVIKSTKTTESTRTIIIPDDLAEKIRQQGYIYKGAPNRLYLKLRDIQTELGIPRFPLHKLRHFFASYLHNEGFTDKQIQAMGGWKTSNVLRSVYEHAMEIEEAKKSASEKIGNIFS